MKVSNQHKPTSSCHKDYPEDLTGLVQRGLQVLHRRKSVYRAHSFNALTVQVYGLDQPALAALTGSASLLWRG